MDLRGNLFKRKFSHTTIDVNTQESDIERNKALVDEESEFNRKKVSEFFKKTGFFNINSECYSTVKKRPLNKSNMVPEPKSLLFASSKLLL